MEKKNDIDISVDEWDYRGKRPYGLKPDPADPNKSVKCFNEFAICETIVWRHKQGDSLRAIARWLEGTKVKNRSGGSFDHSQIKRILEKRGFKP